MRNPSTPPEDGTSRPQNGRTIYPCSKCKTRHHVDELDDFTGLCPDCRGDVPLKAHRACEVCGVAIAGHAHRRTCSERCRKKRSRLLADGLPLPATLSKRRCEVCGIAIAGYSNRKTCGPAHKKTRQRRIVAGEPLPHEQAA